MIDRRNVLTGLSASGALLATDMTALGKEAHRRGQPDLTSEADRFRTFMMMRGAFDEGLITSWVSARYYGVVDDRLDPLFAVVSAVFSRWRQVNDGCEAVTFELAWFVDPLTGKALDSWINPYTGKVNKVPTGGLPPSKFHVSKELSFRLAREIPGLQMAHEVLPLEVRGDDVWLTERVRTSLAIPGVPKPFRYSESNILHARRRDLAHKGATRVTSDVSFTNVCSWRPWMDMGDRPGHLTAIGIGRQNAAADSLPPAWLAATAARRPDVLKDPAALLQPLWEA